MGGGGDLETATARMKDRQKHKDGHVRKKNIDRQTEK